MVKAALSKVIFLDLMLIFLFHRLQGSKSSCLIIILGLNEEPSNFFLNFCYCFCVDNVLDLSFRRTT